MKEKERLSVANAWNHIQLENVDVVVLNDDDPLHSLAMTTIWYTIKRLFRLNIQTSHLRNHFEWFIMYVSVFTTRIHIFNNYSSFCARIITAKAYAL